MERWRWAGEEWGGEGRDGEGNGGEERGGGGKVREEMSDGLVSSV